jgi:imidazole glycerol phosphate synthase subunit HisF
LRGGAEIVLAAFIFRFSILSIREVKEYLESKRLKVHHEKEGAA